MVMDVKSEFQHKALNYLGIIDFFGAQEMTMKFLKVISDDYEEQLDDKNNYPEDYNEEDNIQNTLYYGDSLNVLEN